VESAGGIIIDPGGKTEATFAWGLGKSTNNRAEAYALFQGLRVAADLQIKS
jgi:ribonuclease HI